MSTTPRPPQLVRAELIRLDSHLQAADARGDLERFERWAREVLAHPCAAHTWTVGLITDMLADCLIERDGVAEAAALVAASHAAGQVAEPFATLRSAELALLAGDREQAERLWAQVVGEGPVEAFVALSIGFVVEDMTGDHQAAHDWFGRGITDLLATADVGNPVDLRELDALLEAREASRRALGLPLADELSERALHVPVSSEGAPPREEYPPDPSTRVACPHCGYRPGQADDPVNGYRMAVAWDPAAGPSPEVDQELRRLRADTGQTPALVAAPAEAVAGWAAPHGYDPVGEEARELYAAVAPDALLLPWPPARNEPCWCGSGTKYKRCCGR